VEWTNLQAINFYIIFKQDQKIQKMKKLISLSVVAMMSMAAFAQDTIPNRQNSNPSNRDTIPGSNKNWKDTSSMSRSQDSTYQRRNYPDSLNVDTTSFARKNSMNDSSATTTTDTDSLSTANSSQGATTNKDSMSTTSSTQTNTNTTTTTATADSATVLTDRVIMRDDTMYIIKNGETTNLSETFKLESGATVSREGLVTYPSGKTVTLKNGQFIEITKVTTADNDDKDSDSDMSTSDKKATKTMKKSTKTTKKTTTKKPKDS
jgi:hypothetical protein